MKTIAVLNQKGGVGKTTTSINLATGIANAGKRVLLADNDPQANATDQLLPGRMKLSELELNELLLKWQSEGKSDPIELIKNYLISIKPTQLDMSDLLKDPKLIKDTIQHTNQINLDVIPSSLKLTNAEIQLIMETTKAQHNRLQKALNQVRGDYDYCIIDCLPSSNLLTVNALVSADRVIIPIKIDSGALAGFLTTVENIREINEEYSLGCEWHLLFTMVNRNKVDSKFIEFMTTIFKDRVLNTNIRTGNKGVTKASFDRSLVINDPKSKVGIDYTILSNEVMKL